MKKAGNTWVLDKDGKLHIKKSYDEVNQSRICDCEKDLGLCYCIIKPKEDD